MEVRLCIILHSTILCSATYTFVVGQWQIKNPATEVKVIHSNEEGRNLMNLMICCRCKSLASKYVNVTLPLRVFQVRVWWEKCTFNIRARRRRRRSRIKTMPDPVFHAYRNPGHDIAFGGKKAIIQHYPGPRANNYDRLTTFLSSVHSYPLHKTACIKITLTFYIR